jgi:putative ABC transport system permease protein
MHDESLFMPTTMEDAAQSETKAGVKADYVLGPGASAAAVRAVPGVRAATEVLRTSVRIVQAVTPPTSTGRWISR